MIQSYVFVRASDIFTEANIILYSFSHVQGIDFLFPWRDLQWSKVSFLDRSFILSCNLLKNIYQIWSRMLFRFTHVFVLYDSTTCATLFQMEENACCDKKMCDFVKVNFSLKLKHACYCLTSHLSTILFPQRKWSLRNLEISIDKYQIEANFYFCKLTSIKSPLLKPL